MERVELNNSADKNINLGIWFYNQCDSSICSGLKLKRHNKVKELKKNQTFKGIILYAEAEKFLNPQDDIIVKKYGIAAIDASWNKIQTLQLNNLFQSGHPRRLPFLLATNPCHFGKPYELNCAEAFAAGLFITNYTDESINIMQSFSWGHSFFKENQIFLDLYIKSKYNSNQISKLSERCEYIFRNHKKKINKAKTKNDEIL